MTAIEMRDEFLTRYDAATSLAAPGWTEDEISTFLNIAQLRLTEELYHSGNFTLLSNLIQTDFTVASQSSFIPNGYIVGVDVIFPEFLYYIGSRTKLTRTNPEVTDEYIPNEMLSDIRTAWKYYTSPFNKVYLKYPKCYIDYGESTQTLVVLVDYYTSDVSAIELTAVVKPISIDIGASTGTNMDLATHNTIVNYAVEEAIKSIKVAKISNQ